MIPVLWPISLALEAVLALIYWRRGGFPAFVAFLCYDVLTQGAEMAYASNGAVYPWIHRSAEIGGIVALCFVVAECFEGLRRGHSNGASNETSNNGAANRSNIATLILISAAVTIPTLYLYQPVSWSHVASFVWGAVAMSHALLGILLALMMITAGKWSARGVLLATWMLGTAGLFYLAPGYAVGMAVLWLNTGVWAVLILVSLRDYLASLLSFSVTGSL